MELSNIGVSSKTIGNIFEEANIKYHIPNFQRGFSWEKEQIEQFWNDLEYILAEKRENYFMGSLVLNRETQNDIEIIDGQQRLSALTILLAVIRDNFAEIKDPHSEADADSFICKSTFGNKYFKLTLGEIDEYFFRDFIQYKNNDPERKHIDDYEKIPKKNRKYSHRLIIEAYKYFDGKIKDMLLSVTHKRENLINLAEAVTQKLFVICITVNSDVEAFTIFETLNDRGLELTVSDLLKNNIFSKTSKRELQEVQKNWSDLADILQQNVIPQFLRHFWMSKYKRVTERDLYKEMKISISSRDFSAVEFVKEIRNEAELYDALMNPDENYWGKDRILLTILQNVRLLRAKQCFPLLLSAKQFLSLDNFKKLAKMVEIFTVRYSTICGKNPNELERVYSKLAINIRREGDKIIDNVLQEIKDNSPNDEIFAQNFLVKTVLTRTSSTRYLLEQLELHFGTGEKMAGDSSKVHIEHIMPQSPSKEWKKVIEEENIDFEEYINRLGNLSLLSYKLNIDARNKPFQTKKNEYYKGSEFIITKDLCDYEGWNEKSINDRQKIFTEAALKIWTLNN